jgi:hypothetical protein
MGGFTQVCKVSLRVFELYLQRLLNFIQADDLSLFFSIGKLQELQIPLRIILSLSELHL